MADPDERLGLPGLNPGKDWPGLDPDRDGITFSPDKLKKIAKDLEQELDRLAGGMPGSLSHMSEATRVPYAGTDDWEAGETLHKSLKQGNEHFTEIYRGIVDDYRTAIALIYAGANDYEAVERLASNGGIPG
ncbi:hypothetical protein [Nonomuraea cavernae]|uniref:Uncharacterized protein n=1 Tax=Nonomuraea cavernae TaxID=2045107 RepID=A0A918DS33_9ACTN|nr:hypothetical protein [Nonomuraea cavernae]MCA2190085.1 hypothetical protein [Nonomuraea cavernae]GGO81236.1 hypothetical protein GCM10012289_69760 [Nonomuraea cavernae]